MSRLPSLAFAVLFALSGACDDESGPTDAGQDARRDGSSGCTMADCQGIQKPRVSCTPPTVPEFSCVRTLRPAVHLGPGALRARVRRRDRGGRRNRG